MTGQTCLPFYENTFMFLAHLLGNLRSLCLSAELLTPSSVNYKSCMFLHFSFWPYLITCGILVPQPRTEPRPSAVKAAKPHNTEELSFLHFLKIHLLMYRMLSSHKGQICYFCLLRMNVFGLLRKSSCSRAKDTFTVCFIKLFLETWSTSGGLPCIAQGRI